MKLSRKQFIAACAALALPVESVASLIVVDKSVPLKYPPHAEWYNCDCEDCEAWTEELHERVAKSVNQALSLFWSSIRDEYAPLLKGPLPKYADFQGAEESMIEAVQDWISGTLEDKPLPQRPNWCPVGLDHRHSYFGAEDGTCPNCNQRLWPECTTPH